MPTRRLKEGSGQTVYVALPMRMKESMYTAQDHQNFLGQSPIALHSSRTDKKRNDVRLCLRLLVHNHFNINFEQLALFLTLTRRVHFVMLYKYVNGCVRGSKNCYSSSELMKSEEMPGEGGIATISDDAHCPLN